MVSNDKLFEYTLPSKGKPKNDNNYIEYICSVHRDAIIY